MQFKLFVNNLIVIGTYSVKNKLYIYNKLRVLIT